MQIELKKRTFVGGEVELPASKSISNRALIMLGTEADLQNLSLCQDSLVLRNALSEWPYRIDVGAAGTAMRFLTALLSASSGEHILTGSARMKQRPIAPLVDALRGLGARIDYTEQEGFPPLHIMGKDLQGGKITISGNVSSQFISALIMVAPRMKEGLQIEITGEILSRPYIDMTLALQCHFGISSRWISDHDILVPPGLYKPVTYHIENDWTAASYWYEAVALSQDDGSTVFLPGLSMDSLQGDYVVRQLFEPLGVTTERTSGGIRLTKAPCTARQMKLDFRDNPDLAQTLVVTCTLMNVPFCFSGLESLRIKETDRILALITEMKRIGYVLSQPTPNVLTWDGTRCTAEKSPLIQTYQDHRMAMAFAPASFRMESICINHPEVTDKSYPDFFQQFLHNTR